jgi:hypothetical protein
MVGVTGASAEKADGFEAATSSVPRSGIACSREFAEQARHPDQIFRVTRKISG